MGLSGQKLHATFAHGRVGFVREQLQPVVQRAHRRQQVVAQPGTQQACEIDRADAHSTIPSQRSPFVTGPGSARKATAAKRPCSGPCCTARHPRACPPPRMIHTEPSGTASMNSLHAESYEATNSVQHPDFIHPVTTTVKVSRGAWQHTVPALTIEVIDVPLR